MSRAELDVIRSPSAEAFLRMVTQGFYNRSATALWIYEVIGREWDDLRVISEGLRTETQPQTCAWSMGIWEWIYGIETDENLPLEYRRQALMRRIRGVKPVNPAMLRRGLAALLGTGEEDIEIRDFLRPYTFGVIFRPTGTAVFDYKRVSEYLDASKPAHLAYSLIFQIATARAYAYLAYGGRAETRWGGIVQPPSVGPPKVWTTVIYGGVLSGMAGSAERTVAIPSEVKPPVSKPSLALAHFQFMNQIQRCWNGIVPPPDIGPPEVWTDAIYGGVLAGMAGSAKRTVSVPPEARPPVCGPSMVSARFQFMNQVQRCWNGIVPPPSAGPPKANAKAVYGGVLAGAAGSAKRKIKVPAEVGPPVCKPRCAAALVCHTALRGGMRGSGTALRGEAPRAGANAVYGGALAGMAGHMRMAKRGVELRI